MKIQKNISCYCTCIVKFWKKEIILIVQYNKNVIVLCCIENNLIDIIQLCTFLSCTMKDAGFCHRSAPLCTVWLQELCFIQYFNNPEDYWQGLVISG